MSLQQEVELLRNIPLFANIEASKLKLIAFTAERLKYQAGDILFNQGEIGDAAYIIMNGEADVLVNAPDGPLCVATLKTNDIVGEIAILCDVPRTATVQAKSDLTTLCISKDLFFRLVCEFPQMVVGPAVAQTELQDNSRHVPDQIAGRIQATALRLQAPDRTVQS